METVILIGVPAFSFVALCFLTRTLYALWKRFLQEIGLLRENYRGETIPVGAGGLIALQLIVVTLCYEAAEKSGWMSVADTWKHQLSAALILTLLGGMDDAFGTEEHKGLRGHFSQLFRRARLTTGALKALGGGAVAALLALSLGGSLLDVFLHFLLLALSINAINLFDLRPGRATKFFWLFFALLLLASGQRVDWSLVAPVLISTGVMFGDDLRGRAMMGDAGSNTLGGLLGYWFCLWLPEAGKWFFLVFFLLLHWYAEKRSLTRLIERHEWLRRFDAWGRT
ncbi:glycosyl transferase [Bacillaceae bacterium]